MSRLWEVEGDRGSKLLRRETLTELGGATKIVEDHLDHAMADLSQRQKDAAAAMYNFLVTPSGSKIAHRTRDLAGYAEIEEDDAADVLRRLAAERIVRASAENGAGTRYEIYHDVLADAVSAWGNRYRAERSIHDAERRRRRALIVATAALISLLSRAGDVFSRSDRAAFLFAGPPSTRAEARGCATGRTGSQPAQRRKELAGSARARASGPGGRRFAIRSWRTPSSRCFGAQSPVHFAEFDPLAADRDRRRDGKVRVSGEGRLGCSRACAEPGWPGHGARLRGRLSPDSGTRRHGAALESGRPVPCCGRSIQGASGANSLFGKGSELRGHARRRWPDPVWRKQDGSKLLTIQAERPAIPRGAAADPGGNVLVTFGADRYARMYSLRSWASFAGCSRRVGSIARSSVPTSAPHDLWTRRHRTRLVGYHRSALQRLPGPAVRQRDRGRSVQPSREAGAAAVSDGTARVWEPVTGQADQRDVRSFEPNDVRCLQSPGYSNRHRKPRRTSADLADKREARCRPRRTYRCDQFGRVQSQRPVGSDFE